MRFRKTKVTLMMSCFLMSITLFATSASAEFIYRHNAVSAQVQQRTLWCWAATSSMAGQYSGASAATQTNIVTYIKGSPTINDTGNVYDMQQALAHYGVKSFTHFEPMIFSSVKADINSNKNLVAMIAWNSGGIGHALLIRGYNENTVTKEHNVSYIDPANASYNMMAYNAFVRNNSWYWTNSLTSISK